MRDGLRRTLPRWPAGPVASQDWFVEESANRRRRQSPPDKFICAIGNYGYDWPQRDRHGKLPGGMKDTNSSVQDAWLTARDSEEDVDFDGDSMNPHVGYMDEHNVRHDVWFLDAATH